MLTESDPRPLQRCFYDRPVLQVAEELIGKCLCRRSAAGMTAGQIIEVEAYLGDQDPASHAYKGPKPRNRSMFGPPGHAYVYAIHAKYCMNVVTEPQGIAHAILIRAVLPFCGESLMSQRRGTTVARELTRGPAKLCQAFAIDRELDGWDLTNGESLWIEPHQAEAVASQQIAVTPRIGVTSSKASPLRFVLKGSPYLSGPVRLRSGLPVSAACVVDDPKPSPAATKGKDT